MAYILRIGDANAITNGLAVDLHDSEPGFKFMSYEPQHEGFVDVYGGLRGDILTRHYDGRLMHRLELKLTGDSAASSPEDDLIDRLSVLEFWLRRARAYHLGEREDPVYLEEQIDGSSLATRFPIISGLVNKGDFWDTFKLGQASPGPIIQPMRLDLWTELGESVAALVLENYLQNPQFEEDKVTSGQGDNWNQLGTPTLTMDAAIKLLGKQAQKVVTDASTSEGIRSDTVASDATSGIVVVWVYRADPGDNFQVTLFDVTASQDRGTVKYDTAGWATRVDANGNTWKRLVITSSSLVNGNNHQIDIYRHSADASQATTFYVDQCYLQFGTTAIPTGWSSERTLINHYDQGEGHINYVDVADLPGNALPKIKLQLDITDAGSDLAVPNLLWSRRNKNIDGGFVWFLNATDGTVGTDTSLSADTGAPGGQKAVCDFSTTTTEAERLRIELSSVEPMVGRYRVLLLARQTAGAADDIVVTQVSLDDGGATATLTYDSNTNLPTLPISSTLWTVVDLGVMRVPGFTHPEDYLSDEDFAVRILARRDAGTANLEIAGAIFLPAGESAFTAALTAQTGTFEFHLDSLLVPPSHYQTIGGANPVYAPGLGLLGQFPDAMPGELNRWFFLLLSQTGGNAWLDIDDTVIARVEYKPRFTHLLGVWGRDTFG